MCKLCSVQYSRPTASSSFHCKRLWAVCICAYQLVHCSLECVCVCGWIVHYSAEVWGGLCNGEGGGGRAWWKDGVMHEGGHTVHCLSMLWHVGIGECCLLFICVYAPQLINKALWQRHRYTVCHSSTCCSLPPVDPPKPPEHSHLCSTSIKQNQKIHSKTQTHLVEYFCK